MPFQMLRIINYKLSLKQSLNLSIANLEKIYFISSRVIIQIDNNLVAYTAEVCV